MNHFSFTAFQNFYHQLIIENAVSMFEVEAFLKLKYIKNNTVSGSFPIKTRLEYIIPFHFLL